MNARDEAKDLQVDWALREQLGAEQPPDFTDAVLERLDRDLDDPMPAPVVHLRNRRWLAAALVLLGIGAVLGAALWPCSEKGGDAAPAQAPQDPATELRVFFQNGGGLRAGDAVLVLGKRKGKVAAVEYRKDRQRLRIEVVLRMDEAVPLSTGYQIEIRDSSVLGGKHVQIDPGRGEVLRAGTELVGTTAGNALEGTAQPLVAEGPAGEELKARPTEVANLADVAGLAADTRAIEANAIGDDVLAALAARAGKGELTKLESLSVINPAHQTYGLGLKMQLPPGEQSITAAGMKHIAALSKLRRLVLSGTFALRKGAVAGTGVLDDLVRLPMLQDLTVRFVDTTDGDLAVLPRLPALQQLDLSFNHGFAAGGVAAIVRCGQLRSLSLRGCQQVPTAAFASLGALQQLERLDLGLIDGINRRSVPGESGLDDVEVEIVKRAARRGSPLNDDALTGIAEARNLRWLDLAGGAFGNRGVTALGALDRLQVLNVASVQLPDDFPAGLPQNLRELHVCGDFTDGFCAAVRERFARLRHLDVAACYQITDTGVKSLVAMPGLRVLELRQCRGLTPGCLDSLVKADRIEELDLRHVDWLTAEHVQKLRAGMASLGVLQSNVADSQDAGALPTPARVKSRAEIEALPEGVRSVQGVDLTDDAMPAFARLKRLERLELSADWTLPAPEQGRRNDHRSITDAGLRQLAGLPLRILQLRGQHQVTGPGLQVLSLLPALRECHLHKMVLDDASLAIVAQLPELRAVSLDFCEGFGQPTLRALARLPRLQDLSLRYCSHLDEAAIAELGASRSLECLNLHYVGSHAQYRAWSMGPPRPAVASGSGVTDKALAGLAPLVKLRMLNIAKAGISGDGLHALTGMIDLVQLDLSGVEDLRAADLERLPPRITQLTLQNCDRLDADLGPTLARVLPRLGALDLRSCKGVGDAVLPALVAMASLRRLDLSYCPRFTAGAVPELAKATQLEALLLRGWAETMGRGPLGRLQEMRGLKQFDIEGSMTANAR